MDMIKTNITVTLFNFKDNKEELFFGWDDDVTLIDRIRDALSRKENKKIPCLITAQNMEKNKDGKYIGKANIINILSACCNDGSNWVEQAIILDKIKEILK